MRNRIAFLLASSVLALSVIGFLMIYSASCYSAELKTGDGFFFVKKQFAGFLLGVVLFVATAFIDLNIVKKAAIPLLITSYVLLALVFIPGIGVESYGAKRWVDIKIISFQPSEIAKFSLVVFLSSWFSKGCASELKRIAVPLVCGGVSCLLIIAEPNMSVTVAVGSVLILMLLLGGIKPGYVAILFIVAFIGGVALILIEPYRLQRLAAFVDPWQNPKGEGYQLIQSYYAIGSGGLFGVGYLNSRQKYLFLPFAESDFIFSVICEEFGFFGCVLLVLIYLILIFCGVYASKVAETKFESLLCAGITLITAVQTLINIAVVSGSIPPTGIPLPFISAGGSSLAVFMGAYGTVFNVLVKRRKSPLVFGNKA